MTDGFGDREGEGAGNDEIIRMLGDERISARLGDEAARVAPHAWTSPVQTSSPGEPGTRARTLFHHAIQESRQPTRSYIPNSAWSRPNSTAPNVAP